MRINTDGSKAYRDSLYENTAEMLGENTKTGGIDAACDHAKQDISAKEEAIDFLEERLTARELEEVADLLSTKYVEVSVSISSTVRASED
jgi:hypothetical protein